MVESHSKDLERRGIDLCGHLSGAVWSRGRRSLWQSLSSLWWGSSGSGPCSGWACLPSAAASWPRGSSTDVNSPRTCFLVQATQEPLPAGGAWMAGQGLGRCGPQLSVQAPVGFMARAQLLQNPSVCSLSLFCFQGRTGRKSGLGRPPKTSASNTTLSSADIIHSLQQIFGQPMNVSQRVGTVCLESWNLVLGEVIIKQTEKQKVVLF